jgi:hypothetical protein
MRALFVEKDRLSFIVIGAILYYGFGFDVLRTPPETV